MSLIEKTAKELASLPSAERQRKLRRQPFIVSTALMRVMLRRCREEVTLCVS